MPTKLLLGDEAVAQGAIDAGLSGAYAYPGTPSTEITEYVEKSPQAREGLIRSFWSANEKTAVEAALGMSYAGKRAMASMKHVGLNVAADPFINAAITGTSGGLIVNAADDPSMHSSQNEQDSRLYTEIALVPCLEPSNQQEAYDMVSYAFDLSERFRVPVLLRLVTRLAHSRAPVTLRTRREQNRARLPDDPERFIILPPTARRQYAALVARQEDFVRESERSPFNHLADGPDASLGIVASGIGANYVLEAFAGEVPHPFLKIGQYPLPALLVDRLFHRCERILVVEEGYPYIEAKLRGLPERRSPQILGRMSGELPRTGELTPALVARALGRRAGAGIPPSSVPVPRPPSLCPGCPHADTFRALTEALGTFPETARVFSDIGCYTLGAYPPFSAIHTCVEMGASITMAKGAADAGIGPVVSVIGDSTFAHSGMTGLLDAVLDRSPITVVILDNLAVAMTGGQRSCATGRLEAICTGLGVEPAHVREIVPVPKEHEKNVAVLREEIRYAGPSVVIARRECLQTARRAKRPAREGA
ncbi:MAG: thiamine pyrophosphate-dependent enzyme [Candidatus Bipolaricaulota bacterium]|nr:thiamine pyrophosphate-dependent enzyme [Candidatus Bipolaricaulota bacterium]